MEWSEQSRSLYIRTSIGMAGLIAVKNDIEHAQCIEGWYYADEVAANDLMYQAMLDFPDVHPRGIIMAMLVKQCGSFDYSDR